MKKWLMYALLVFVIIQVIRPEKNLSANDTYHVAKKYEVSSELNSIFENACYDCHSNKTTYPWYSNIQPAGWWLSSHVNGGKKHLNFSEFTNLKVAVQNHKFEEIAELVEEKEMPIPSYTWFGLHPKAKINEDQRKLIINWARTNMDSLKAQYPADSLILKRMKK